MTDKNANTEIRKEFCPNCEAETPCTHEAELYVCDICGEDFAKYIVSRNCNVSDVSMTRDVSTDVKTPSSIENTNPDYYKQEIARRDKIIKRLKEDAERLKEANEDVQSRLDDYRQDYATVVNDQCPTDERHCGCVPILRRENRILSEDLANAKLKLHKYQKALLLIITMPKLSQAITIAINALNETGKYSWSEESVGEYWVNQLSMLQDKYDILERDYADVCAKRIEAADSFSKEIIELRNINRELQKFYDEMTDSLETPKQEDA